MHSECYRIEMGLNVEKTLDVFLYKLADLFVVYAHLKCYNIGMRLVVE